MKEIQLSIYTLCSRKGIRSYHSIEIYSARVDLLGGTDVTTPAFRSSVSPVDLPSFIGIRLSSSVAVVIAKDTFASREYIQILGA